MVNSPDGQRIPFRFVSSHQTKQIVYETCGKLGSPVRACQSCFADGQARRSRRTCRTFSAELAVAGGSGAPGPAWPRWTHPPRGLNAVGIGRGVAMCERVGDGARRAQPGANPVGATAHGPLLSRVETIGVVRGKPMWRNRGVFGDPAVPLTDAQLRTARNAARRAALCGPPGVHIAGIATPRVRRIWIGRAGRTSTCANIAATVAEPRRRSPTRTDSVTTEVGHESPDRRRHVSRAG